MEKLAVILEKYCKQEIFICEVEIDKEDNSMQKRNNKPIFKVNDLLLRGITMEFDYQKFLIDELTGEIEEDGIIFYRGGLWGEQTEEGLVYLLEKDRMEGLIKSYMQGCDRQYLFDITRYGYGECLIKAMETNERQRISSRLIQNEDKSNDEWIDLYVYPDGRIIEVIESLK